MKTSELEIMATHPEDGEGAGYKVHMTKTGSHFHVGNPLNAARTASARFPEWRISGPDHDAVVANLPTRMWCPAKLRTRLRAYETLKGRRQSPVYLHYITNRFMANQFMERRYQRSTERQYLPLIRWICVALCISLTIYIGVTIGNDLDAAGVAPFKHKTDLEKAAQFSAIYRLTGIAAFVVTPALLFLRQCSRHWKLIFTLGFMLLLSGHVLGLNVMEQAESNMFVMHITRTEEALMNGTASDAIPRSVAPTVSNTTDLNETLQKWKDGDIMDEVVKDRNAMNLVKTRIWPLIGGVICLVLRLDFLHCLFISVVTNAVWLLGWGVYCIHSPPKFEKTILMQVLAVGVTLVACHIMDRHLRIQFVTVHELEEDKKVLKQKLKDLEKKDDTRGPANITTPIESVIGNLQRMLKSAGLDEEWEEQLRAALSTLTSNNLTRPDLQRQLAAGGGLDQELKSYLLSFESHDSSRGRRKLADVKRGSRARGHTMRLGPGAGAEMWAKGGISAQIDTLLTSEPIVSTLGDLRSWDLDVFKLAEQSDRRPLFFLGWKVFKNMYSQLNECGVEISAISPFLTAIEKGYDDVPYHNSMHAADTVNSVYYMLEVLNIKQDLNTRQYVSLIIAAMIHDFKHTGTSNGYQVKTQSRIALTFSDSSVLERMHLAEAFHLMKDPKADCDIFHRTKEEDRVELRRNIINIVLATDLSNHFEITGKLKALISADQGHEAREDSELLMKLVMKLADIGHSSKRAPLHMKWSSLIIEEFFQQGDEERRQKMKISAFMDRENEDSPKNQVGFFDYLVKPLYEASAECVPNFDPLVGYCTLNYNLWVEYAKSGTKTMKGIMDHFEAQPVVHPGSDEWAPSHCAAGGRGGPGGSLANGG